MPISNTQLTVEEEKWLPSDIDLGPAMKALAPRHRLFVVACLDSGTKMSFARAAKLAGYAKGKPGQATLRVRGHRLAHSTKIQAAILEEAQKRLQVGTITATNLLLEAISDRGAELKDRLKAAQMVMDRGGMSAVIKHEVQHHDDRQSKVIRLAQLAVAAGEDPRLVLGNLADALEGDFKVLEKDATESETTEEAQAPAVPEASESALSQSGIT